MLGIYKITSPSNKIYIGQSVDIKRRWGEHKTDSYFSKLRYSFKKYGFESHKFEILEECSVELLNERERYYQDLYDVLGPNGLNLKLTEVNDRSGFYSQELRDKLSNSQKEYNKNLTNEQRLSKNKKNSDSKKHKQLSEVHKENSTEGVRRYWSRKIKNQTEEESILLSKKMQLIRKGQLSSLNSKRVIDELTMETFDSIKLASETTNYSMNSLSNMLRGVTKNKTNFKYLV